MKKLLAILLSALMLMSFGFTAFAAGSETTGSITVTNATAGETYKVYKVFDLTYDGTEETKNSDGNMSTFVGTVAYSITETDSNAALIGVLKNGYGEGEAHVASPFTLEKTTVTNVYNVKVNDGYADAATGEAKPELISFMKYLASKNYLTEVATAEATGTTVNFAGLGLGYYYVSSTLGSVVTIDSTLKNVEIKDKNTVPDITKKIMVGSTEETWNTASFGDIVNFKITVDAYKGAENYVITDYVPTPGSVSGGGLFTLLLNNRSDSQELEYFKGTVNGGTYKNAAVTFKNSGDDYDLYIGADKIGTMTVSEYSSVYHNNFVITFEQSFLDTITEYTSIVINYSARLREATGSNYFMVTNNTYLTYGKSATQSETSTTQTFAYKFDIFKYTGNKSALAGAEFELKNENGTVITFDNLLVLNDGTSQYVVNTENGANSKVVSPEKGKIRIRGLAAGTYTLTETKAPDGYNALPYSITVEIDTSGNVRYHNGNDQWIINQTQVEVENNSGSELPSTGGIGTTIFYIVGGVLVAGAVVFFIVRRRMNAGNKAK